MGDMGIGSATVLAGSLDMIGVFQQQDVAIRIAYHCGSQVSAERGDVRRNEADAIALYERVESVLAAEIADGSLLPETQLPPEEGLIERFKVSRTTVRKAIQNLVERGLVEVQEG
jgi:DNA-binding MarR family transcriptional regulator